MARATNCCTHVPDRYNGYGFGDENCENAISDYPDLIVLLDCGTQNHSSIAKTGEMAIDVLVVDHHQPAETLPSAYAIVNPHRHDESIEGQELRNLCTAGLAFMRSEEHTSELQSLMRISYAVFCLKKKKKLNYSNEENESNAKGDYCIEDLTEYTNNKLAVLTAYAITIVITDLEP